MMKKLASIILALLMVLLTVPCYHVSAEADSPLNDKILVGEVNDMCIASSNRQPREYNL